MGNNGEKMEWTGRETKGRIACEKQRFVRWVRWVVRKEENEEEEY